MLRAIAALHTYWHPTLEHSFYATTLVAAVGYFAAIGCGEVLNRVQEAAHRRSEGASNSLQTRLWAGVHLLASERWVWIAPVVLVAALYLSVIFQPGHAESGPVMYALF
jgi:hypothetical protein